MELFQLFASWINHMYPLSYLVNRQFLITSFARLKLFFIVDSFRPFVFKVIHNSFEFIHNSQLCGGEYYDRIRNDLSHK